jgi:hypothetical protein
LSSDIEPSAAVRAPGAGARSAFDPPRAGGPGICEGLWARLLGEWHLETIRLPARPGPGARWVSLVVPGYAFCIQGRRILGCMQMGLYGASACCFLVWLGHVAADLAVGMMMSLHAVSLLYLARCRPALPSLRWQALQALGVVLVLSLLVYPSLRRYVERHWFMPLTVRQQVVVIDTRPSARHVERGDWIAFRYDAIQAGNVRLPGGFGMGVVEGVGGDRVVFGPDDYTILGLRHRRRSMMPRSGSWQVPENHWFVWPDSSISVAGNTANLTPLLPDLALVPAERCVGRPFRHWFGRDQMRP